MLLLLFVLAEVERLVYDLVLHDPKTLELFDQLGDNIDYSVPSNAMDSKTGIKSVFYVNLNC